MVPRTKQGWNAVMVYGDVPPGWETDALPLVTDYCLNTLQAEGGRVVPPEEWPPEVCTAIARYHLTGEVA